MCFFFSCRRRHTSCALVTGVQTCALPIFRWLDVDETEIQPPLAAAADEAQKLDRDQQYQHADIGEIGEILENADREAPDDQRHSQENEKAHALLPRRSEEHTSELQSLMRISYAVFCLKKKKHKTNTHIKIQHIIIKTTK